MLDPRWSTTLLRVCMAISAWLGAALVTGIAIPEPTHSYHARSVAFVGGLLAIPIVGSVFGWLIAFAVTRQGRSAVRSSGERRGVGPARSGAAAVGHHHLCLARRDPAPRERSSALDVQCGGPGARGSASHADISAAAFGRDARS